MTGNSPENRKEVIDTKIGRAIRKINEAAANAHLEKGKEGYSEAVEEFYSVLKTEYSTYLRYTNIAYFYAGVDGYDSYDRQKTMNDIYCCAIIEKKFSVGRLRNFDPEKNHKGEFFSYFNSAVKKQFKIYVNSEKNRERSNGLNKVYSDKKRDQRLLKEFFNFVYSSYDNGVCEPNNKSINIFCKIMAEEPQLIAEDLRNAAKDPQKIADILNAYYNSEVKVSDESIEYEFEEGVKTDFASVAFAKYLSQINEENKPEFEKALLAIDEVLLDDSLSHETKNMLSVYITASYINEIIEETKNRNKYKSIEDTLKNHFDYTHLNAIKEMYASGKYYCMRPEVFDYVIEKREKVTQKQIAEYFGCTDVNIINIKKRYFEKIRNRYKEKYGYIFNEKAAESKK